MFHPSGSGCRSKEGALSKTSRLVRVGQEELGNRENEEEKRRKLTEGGGLAWEYGSLPNCHSSVSLQFAR